ncbi:hypothetical protein GF361_00590 [Candidatus Woesearchaeota archaeon]|nr:hypothetical protein [Candidatus Woesearchaeota archaeon]
MGQGKYKRKAEKLANKQRRKEEREGIVSKKKRRIWPWILGTTLLAGGVVSTLYDYFSEPEKVIPAKVQSSNIKKKDDKWDFVVNKVEHFKGWDVDRVKEICSPIGPESDVGDKQKKILEAKIIDEIKKNGYDMGGDYKIDAKMRRYGVPVEKTATIPLSEFCQEAIKFMHSHPELKAFRWKDAEGVTIGKGCDFRENFDAKFFAVNGYYKVATLTATNKNDLKQKISIEDALFTSGAFAGIVRDEEKRIDQWYILMSAADPSVLMVAPFSEMIPLKMDAATIRYEDRFGSKKALQAAETVSEGISHNLALEFVEKMKIPNGKEMVESALANLSDVEQYDFVVDSVRWVRQNSISEAIEIYMNDAEEYMDAVMNMPAISFEEARDFGSMRAPYLEKLVAEESKENEIWKCLDKIVYDPGFRAYEIDTGNNVIGNMKKNQNYGKISEDVDGMVFVPLAVTHLKGKNAVCYFDDASFDKKYSEDEIKSLLDNEAYNAYLGEIGKFPVKMIYSFKGEISDKTNRMAAELLSFDHQIFRIKKGERKVSDDFAQKYIGMFGRLYDEMKYISQNDDADGNFTKNILASLKCNINKK